MIRRTQKPRTQEDSSLKSEQMSKVTTTGFHGRMDHVDASALSDAFKLVEALQFIQSHHYPTRPHLAPDIDN